jgi:2,3-diketo-5-methylthio-1-phosphopentane phosphatase
MNEQVVWVDSRTGGAPGWTVLCDFDGTISLQDVTDTLLERFGRPGWRELEARWERGEIGSRECMKGQVALLDMGVDEFSRHLESIAIDPHFAAFVDGARALGVPVQVVSDGIEQAIVQVLARHGLQRLPVLANRLVQAGARAWRLESPHASPRCERASGNCKCERLAEQRPLMGGVHGRVLYVGDGASDFCVSGKADFVLAKDRLVDHCRARGMPFAPYAHFGEVLGRLAALVAEGTEAKVGH